MALYRSTPRTRAFGLLAVAALTALPWIAQALGQEFYIGFAARVLVLALAATSLNLVLGFGGMISFGHAAFFGAGAYTVAILAQQGMASAWLAWPAAIGVGALLAAVVGAVSLRTRGVYFIMITLAFAQMAYYLVLSLKVSGGDDGLPLPVRSGLGFGLDAADDTTFFYAVLIVFSLALAGLSRLAGSRFGRVIQAIRENESRMEAIGYPVFHYKLACFVLGGAVAGLAGALMANQTGLASRNELSWLQSGMLMVMVILGGVGSLWGGFVGAALLLLVEEILSGLTVHHQLGVGIALLAVVLWAPRGVAGLFARNGDG